MTKNPLPEPLRFAMTGAASGALFLIAAVLACAERNPLKFVDWANLRWSTTDAIDWDDVTRFLCYPALLGGVSGSALGLVLWVLRTERHVPLFWLVFSWWLLCATIGLLLGAAGFLALTLSGTLSAGRDGSGGPGLALVLLLLCALGASLGSVLGVVVGVNKARLRRLANSPPPTGVNGPSGFIRPGT